MSEIKVNEFVHTLIFKKQLWQIDEKTLILLNTRKILKPNEWFKIIPLGIEASGIARITRFFFNFTVNSVFK